MNVCVQQNLVVDCVVQFEIRYNSVKLVYCIMAGIKTHMCLFFDLLGSRTKTY